MATTTLTPSSIISATGWTGATTGNLESSNDARATGGTAGELILVELTDTPADFGNVSGNITLRVEARTVGTVTRAKSVLLELLDGANNVLGSGSSGTLSGTDGTHTVTVSGRTDDKTAADAFRLRATVQEGGGMADSATVEIDLLNVDVIYDPAAVVQDASVAFSGAGTTAAVGQLLRNALLTAAGVATVAFTGVRVAEASVAFTGAATASFTGSKAGTSQDASVAFAGSGAVTLAGGKVTDAGASYAGAGAAAFAAGLVRDGSVGWSGVGGAGFAAGLVRDGAASFAGAGTAAIAGELVWDASAAWTGAGSAAFAGEVVKDASLAMGGVGTASFAGERVAEASVAFSGTGSAAFTPEGAAPVQTASVVYTGSGSAQLAGYRVAEAGVAYGGIGGFAASAKRDAVGRIGFTGACTVSFTGATDAEPLAAVVDLCHYDLTLDPALRCRDITLEPVFTAAIAIGEA